MNPDPGRMRAINWGTIRIPRVPSSSCGLLSRTRVIFQGKALNLCIKSRVRPERRGSDPVLVPDPSQFDGSVLTVLIMIKEKRFPGSKVCVTKVKFFNNRSQMMIIPSTYRDFNPFVFSKIFWSGWQFGFCWTVKN